MLGFGCQREFGVHAQVDMTDAQLAVARKYVDEYTQLLGYSQPNLSFRKGTIENLKEVSGEEETRTRRWGTHSPARSFWLSFMLGWWYVR
jgi:hypothetical protein